jgi:signal transduction histidine kinase
MRARRSLRTRLAIAFVALAAGVLVVAGTATYVLARATARQEAIDDLTEKSRVVGRQTGALQRLFTDAFAENGADVRPLAGAMRALSGVLRIADARVVFLSDDGEILTGGEVRLPGTRTNGPAATVFELPDELSEDALDTRGLLAGATVDGSAGATVFSARPIGLGRPARVVQNYRPVLVLTQDVDTNVIGRAGPFFLVAAGLALLAAIVTAFWLARRMTRPVLAMASELETARGAQRAFLLNISHDLRTPLTSIRGYAEALADGTLDGSDTDARERAASVITAEARRLERLVRDLLDLSRLDSQEFSLHPRRCDATEVVADAAEAFAPAAHDIGVALVVQRDGTIPATVDPDRLAQVVANLVENALKYATKEVSVDVHQVGATIEVAVVDDGPGIDDAELAHVFERLYTGRTSPGRALGTGLGLAIVRELAQAMGGTAVAERGGNGGARFVVRVPATRP